ncbi:unannotated protein [freshwater metagenome]|uniref:Unannotated protein n=1 Tax=freshwater metagenome TaxID=449393 RepID=A0A6J6I3K4_9ZZZZ
MPSRAWGFKSPLGHHDFQEPQLSNAKGLVTDDDIRDQALCIGRVLLQIKTVCFHHLDPRGNKIVHELFARVGLCIDLRNGAQL